MMRKMSNGINRIKDTADLARVRKLLGLPAAHQINSPVLLNDTIVSTIIDYNKK